MKQKRFALTIVMAAVLAGSSVALADNVFREFGKDVKSATKQAGKDGKQVGKSIGRTGRDIGKATSKAARDLFKD